MLKPSRIRPPTPLPAGMTGGRLLNPLGAEGSRENPLGTLTVAPRAEEKARRRQKPTCGQVAASLLPWIVALIRWFGGREIVLNPFKGHLPADALGDIRTTRSSQDDRYRSPPHPIRELAPVMCFSKPDRIPNPFSVNTFSRCDVLPAPGFHLNIDETT